MARGGKRPGAGRPKGSKDKPKGPSIEVMQAALPPIIDTSLMPLDLMLGLMRHPDVPPVVRIEMAKLAAPYCHAKPAPSKAPGDAPDPNDAAAAAGWEEDLGEARPH